MCAWILRRSFQPSNSVFPVWRRIDIEKRGNWNVFGKNRGIIDGGCFSRVHDGDDEWERDYSAEVFWKKKIMFAHRSTLLVYSLELPFASFIDFFSSRYENSFEWPDGTRGLLKADERVYFSVTENPKWRPDTGTPVEWPYKENALNSSNWNNADERKTHGNPNVCLYV